MSPGSLPNQPGSFGDSQKMMPMIISTAPTSINDFPRNLNSICNSNTNQSAKGR